ncbi:pyrimidine-nucleoside phosphorylase [Youngiibacter fragilis]|uniref:Pyrimidine-nucleoside phosphorylase n=1 Tax=Youngiibacter fragilis 232.1 TaxID=994573 RepID=V7I2F5_9CLOT|nr:pyrimidine-nucleoside phosphorylase [Youngiibacter fragilis]ETA79182.1 pyrimidine-nucleoside phosphorylase [Youngiibacter fragilis 232.1]
MRMLDIIQNKKHGMELSAEEIDFFVQGYTKGEIPDYQASALLMAIWFKGMSEAETANLTKSMVNSGDTLDLSGIKGVKVDKHSTGGVGDKVSLVVIPLVAALGIKVAKMSGRGLGHTGGTIDKLGSIPGFNTSITMDQFISNVNSHGMAIVGQTANLVPADKKLYALRDVTATVDSIPLIASSIMSKKIASGSDAIVLDVKVGSGAFMKTIEDARTLARAMVGIGNNLGRRTIAILSNMDEPLGSEIGNANEVREAILTLKGEAEKDLINVACAIAAQMAVAGGAFTDVSEAEKAVMELITSGKAVDFLAELVEIQGGDKRVIYDPELLPKAGFVIPVVSEKEGYVHSIMAEEIGTAAMLLGAGRETKEDEVDHSAGITLKKKVGDRVEKGDVLCILMTNRENHDAALSKAHEAYVVTEVPPDKVPYILDVIG